jgi:hypothetical protein
MVHNTGSILLHTLVIVISCYIGWLGESKAEEHVPPHDEDRPRRNLSMVVNG